MLDQRLHNTDADKAVADRLFEGTARELRQFVERVEQLEAEKRDIAEQQKEVFAEAKGRGYDTKALREVIKLRRQNADARAEFEAVMDIYRGALGL